MYRKATNADIVLHKNCNSLASHKRSCVTGLFSRITTQCSNAEARNQEKSYLHSNGYPLNFIKRALRHQNSQPPPTTNGESAPPTWRALPYVKNVSELIARHLHPFNFFIYHKPTKLLRGTLVNLKDPLPTPEQRNVVYHIPCSDCPMHSWAKPVNSYLHV